MDTHDSFFRYISTYSSTPLSEADVALLKKVFVPQKFRKRQYFLQSGQVCKYMAFIVKGAMRQYSVDNKGAEHIVRLSIENWWAGDRESAINLTPSIYNIDAWEDTDALVITGADMNTIRAIPAVAEMTLNLDNNHAFALQRRVNASISLSAEERYTELEKTYPEFLQRFPQHIIASYLGITKETLSRVRSNAVKK